jgi:hypothetical protein
MGLGLSWGKEGISGESSQTRNRRERIDNQKGQEVEHCLAYESCLNDVCCQIEQFVSVSGGPFSHGDCICKPDARKGSKI